MTMRSKWPGPNRRATLLHLVDQAHHRRVGRDVHAAIAVALGHEVHWRRCGQMGLERADRLIHERNAVRKEEDALRPVAAHEEVESAMTVRVFLRRSPSRGAPSVRGRSRTPPRSCRMARVW